MPDTTMESGTDRIPMVPLSPFHLVLLFLTIRLLSLVAAYMIVYGR